MNKKKIPQHVQVPMNQDLTPDEKLLYAFMKKRMDKKTNTSFQSISTLSKLTSFNEKKVRKLLHSLEEKKVIDIIERPGRSSIYKFHPYSKFEPFSMEFLDDTELPIDTKKALICFQEHMFINCDTHQGKISYSDAKLSELTSLNRKFIAKQNKILEDLGYMTKVQLRNKNSETGLFEQEKFYYLDKFKQAVAYILSDHEERIEQNEKDVMLLQRKIEELEKRLALQEAKQNAITL